MCTYCKPLIKKDKLPSRCVLNGAAVSKLREINWLYQNVDESSVDDAVKKVIEVVNSANSKVLEKATSEDIASFQSYTIRNLESKLPVQSDIDQFVEQV